MNLYETRLANVKWMHSLFELSIINYSVRIQIHEMFRSVEGVWLSDRFVFRRFHCEVVSIPTETALLPHDRGIYHAARVSACTLVHERYVPLDV